MVSPQVPKRRLNNTQKVLLDAINLSMSPDAGHTDNSLYYRMAFIREVIKRSEPEIADMLRLMMESAK